ncbi:MAG: CotH kinase family protein [Cytophagaceae bacterium]
MRYYLFLLAFVFAQQVQAQLIINEVSASNSTVQVDEDGDYPDWLELYNAGSTTLNLSDYFLSDNGAQPFKWRIPEVSLAPGAFQLVYCSEKNRGRFIHHWETAVFEGDTWKYLIPSSEPSSTWRLAGFNDAAWNSGQGGIGLGDSDDATLVPNGTTSVYLRKSFNINDTSKISACALHIDYDDGYIAYLNGVVIAKSNVPDIPFFNSLATNSREATMYTGGLPELKMLSLDTIKLALRNGENVLAIQVYNINDQSSDLSARPFLSFGIKDNSVIFSNPPSWFNLSTTLPLHTNFKISAEEILSIRNSSGTVIHQLTVPSMLTDQSYGSNPDGSNTNVYFSLPTPNLSNNSSPSFIDYCRDTVKFDKVAGFYPSIITVLLTGSSEIRYTLDGSVPTASSTLYTTPISIPTTTVVRASCFNAASPPRSVFTQTYIINKNTSLPVFSISTNPELLFDPVTGIYMKGPDAEPVSPFFGANFWEETEIPIHVEFFETNKQQYINQDAALRISGNYSRANDQKSFVLKAYQRFGDKDFSHSFFPEKNITDFTQIVLRNSGGDFNYMHYHDGFVQKSMGSNTNMEYQDYRAAVVFINGEYWGILNIREKINEHFVEDNSGVNSDDVDLAETWGDALEGSNNIWQMQWWATNMDMTVTANFKTVADSFDLDNLMDHYALQIFISNWDWPQNNVKYWRDRNGSRKWRMILWDTDLSLGLYDLNPVTFNALANVVNSADATKNPVTDVFKNLLKNTSFRNQFVNRYADLMNTTFKPSELDKYLYALKDSIDEEMVYHSARWNGWKNLNVAAKEAHDFYTARIPIARNEIKNQFTLVKQVNLTLQVLPAGAGVIKINTIIPGVSPWTGVYFDGVPVTVTVIPNPGYTFVNWTALNSSLSNANQKSMTLNISSVNETLTANFTGSASPLKIIVNEINYKSSPFKDAGDWIELYNNGTNDVDMSGWYIQDSKHYNKYVFPMNTIVKSGEYLVLYSDNALFSNRHPFVTNKIGPIGFNWDNNGEQIRLYTATGTKYLEFTYDNNLPWPIEANGVGYTIQLTNFNADPSLAASWEISCMEGTPGGAPTPGCVTSVKSSQSATSISNLYPNPARDQVSIDLWSQENMQYQIEDISGRVLLSGELNGQSINEVNVQMLSSGIYICRIISEETNYVHRFVIRK